MERGKAAEGRKRRGKGTVRSEMKSSCSHHKWCGPPKCVEEDSAVCGTEPQTGPEPTS